MPTLNGTDLRKGPPSRSDGGEAANGGGDRRPPVDERGGSFGSPPCPTYPMAEALGPRDISRLFGQATRARLAFGCRRDAGTRELPDLASSASSWPVLGDAWLIHGWRWPILLERWPILVARWSILGDTWPIRPARAGRSCWNGGRFSARGRRCALRGRPILLERPPRLAAQWPGATLADSVPLSERRHARGHRRLGRGSVDRPSVAYRTPGPSCHASPSTARICLSLSVPPANPAGEPPAAPPAQPSPQGSPTAGR
jgi:hypothetical protein